jgi:hypothetical protein
VALLVLLAHKAKEVKKANAVSKAHKVLLALLVRKAHQETNRQRTRSDGQESVDHRFHFPIYLRFSKIYLGCSSQTFYPR